MTAVAAGATVGLGLFVAVVALFGNPTLPQRHRGTVPTWARDRLLLRVALGAAAAIVVWAVTEWPVGGLLGGLGAAAAPSLVGAKAARAVGVARIEAIAGWAEQLRDVMAAADGIQSAIIGTAPLAPAPIRPHVRRLGERLNQRDRLDVALGGFAADVAHPLADMIVTSLLIASEHQGRLTELLSEVAASARATATMRLRVEAARARTYVTTRLIIGITIAMSAWLVLLQRDYLTPFDSAAGQVMLAVIGATFAASGVLMQRMARPVEPMRLLAAVEHQRGSW